jgi:DNA repair exonuclease SbcCD ATPase subunit
MAATLKRPEETMPSLISRACGGSISARGSDAVRSDSRPGTAQETPLSRPRATKGRHPVERQLAEGQLLDVEEHNRRVAEQREDLLAKLRQAMVLQTEQTDRAQRAVQAEWRAELMAVREGLELRTSQLQHELIGACERLETNSPADSQVAALKAECERLRLELAELQRRCGYLEG